MNLETNQINNEGFLIEANPKYNIIPPATVLLQNTAECVNHELGITSSVSQNVLNFKLKVNGNFLDRGVTVQFPNIPLNIGRKTVLANAPTSADFITTFFNGYSNFCMSEFGMINAIDTIKLSLDGYTISVSDIAEKLRVLAQYYDPEDVHKHFPNSLPDVYNDYRLTVAADAVGSNNSLLLSTVASTDNELFTMKRPDLPNFNPFTCNLEEKYTTRIPNFIFTDATIGSVNVSLVDQSIFLPFSGLFSLPGDPLPVYNIDTVDITIKLKANWEQYIFSVRDTVNLINTVKFNSSLLTKFTPKLHYRTYTAPQYIEAVRTKEVEYAMNYSNSIIDSSVQDVPLLALKTTTISSQQYTLTQIPKKIVVYCIPKIMTADSEALLIPNYFARFESLTVKLGGVNTILAADNSLQLYEISKRNGLNTNKESALYCKGFPVLLNVSDDLGCKSNSLIGGTDGNNTCVITAKVTNLNSSLTKVTYTFKTMFIYDSIIKYDPLKKRMDIVDSIFPDDERSIDLHSDNLTQKTMQNANLLGGSWLSAIGNYAKDFGKGAWNVIKAIATNKEGFRDDLVKRYQGAGHVGGQVIYSQGSNTVGGAQFDNHMSVTGGQSIANWGRK